MSPEAIKAEQQRRQSEIRAAQEAAKERHSHIGACVEVGLCPDCGGPITAIRVDPGAYFAQFWECEDIECFKVWGGMSYCRDRNNWGKEISRSYLAAEFAKYKEAKNLERLYYGLFIIALIGIPALTWAFRS